MSDKKAPGWTGILMGGWKFHFVPDSLLGGIMQDANRRGHTDVHVQEARNQCELDLGGMLMLGRSVQKVHVDGFELRVPSQDFSVIHDELLHSPLRMTVDGLPYYKIHGAYCCVVLTPEQRQRVIEEWDRIAPEAEAQAEADQQEFLRRLDQINKDGVKIISARDPRNRVPLSGTPNFEKN